MFYTDKFINSIAKIVDHVLITLDMHSQDAFDLVMRTGMQESKFKYLEQIGGGPGLGFWQTEPGMTGAEDTWVNYLMFKTAIREKLVLVAPLGPWDEITIMGNIALQVALCRLKYRRDPHRIPSDIPGQASYWKRVYNTPLGAGTEAEFVAHAIHLEGFKGT